VSFFRSRLELPNLPAGVTLPMDPQARLLLEAFDAPELRKSADTARDGLTLGTLANYLTHDKESIRLLAEDLLARGCLRHPAAGADNDPHDRVSSAATEVQSEVYVRTEDGILAVAGPLDVTLYTRPGCHLCEEAKQKMAPLLLLAGARLREVNIDADPVLRERYDFDVPVVLLGTRKIAKHRVDIEQLRRQLVEARRGARNG
jgi:glutaredoxin